MLGRRRFLHTAAVTATGASVIGSADAQPLSPDLPDPAGTTPRPRNWDEPIVVYPDPTMEAFDPRFKKYLSGIGPCRRVYTGAAFTEGPVYFGDMHCVIFSDIPNNRLLRYDELTDATTIFREPSNNANGNTRDWQGRLLSCEQRLRRVTRTEYGGDITVLADSYQGKRLNGPNGVVVKRDDGTIWFTDPTYGIEGDIQGIRGVEELPRQVYMVDPHNGRIRVAADGFDEPNGLCFSPDLKTMYITDTGKTSMIRAFDVGPDNKLINDRIFHHFKNGGISDDIRADMDGNIWSAGGWADDPNFNGVSVYSPRGEPLGRIVLPEIAGNLCFGGLWHQNSVLYIAATASLYQFPVNTRGVEL